MFIKVLFALALVAVIVWGLYLGVMAIYNHWFNSARRDAEELQYHYDRLNKLIKDKQLER